MGGGGGGAALIMGSCRSRGGGGGWQIWSFLGDVGENSCRFKGVRDEQLASE
jgi:hypothetical protein